jgi:hypothetical protein
LKKNKYSIAITRHRMKTVQLEKIKLRIINQVENSDAEEKCLGEYRRELELLMQEKMSHVEELRQIHADINAVSDVIFKVGF